ncbi:MAG TPA: helix-turn-helix domain-containing protein [Anaerolineales bacterium]|nr:helix-turn-helix domain-containing protein [Anaerolineales bacterium]
MTKDWISLKEAAEIVGVHPSTIRLWSNKGILPVHRTPGGHRRFRRADVELWVEHVRRDSLQPEAIMQSAVRNVRVRIAEGQLQAEGWYQKLDEDARQQYRQSAHTLFQGLLSYLASSTHDSASEAHAIGFDYASRAHRCSLSYVEAAQAFLFFRNTLIESVVHAYREANVPFDEVLRRMHVFTDEILVSLLQTYQSLERAAP